MFFCARCGQRANTEDQARAHLTGACAHAAVVSAASLVDADGTTRCPVGGCAWRLDGNTQRSRQKARDTFFLHLEWHERTRVYGTQQAAEGATSAPGPLTVDAFVGAVVAALEGRHAPDDLEAVRRVATRELASFVESLRLQC